MENTIPFELNEAVRLWREKLSGSPAFCADNLDELETHLRSSVERLQATGLAADEAFMVARHRMGEVTTLEREYGKINSGSVWGTRIMWMAAGLILSQMIVLFGTTISQILMGMMPKGYNDFYGLIWLVSRAIVALLFLWLIVRHGQRASLLLERWIKKCLDRPFLSVLGLGVFFAGFILINIFVIWLIWWCRGATGANYVSARLHQFAVWEMGQSLVMPAVLIFLARRQFRGKVVR